jgi:hypothetical protein
MKYRQKPIIVEAVQFTGTTEWARWPDFIRSTASGHHYWVKNEARLLIFPGGWIVTFEDGDVEFYTRRKFEALFERVED